VATLPSDIYGGQTSYQPVAALKSRSVTADDTTDQQTEKKTFLVFLRLHYDAIKNTFTVFLSHCLSFGITGVQISP
jgi:hypothetical protein